MEDDIDIEEHDVLEHPRIRNIFPDLTHIKTEVPDENYDDQEMDYTPYSDNETGNDEGSSENAQQGNKIILGSKPSLRIHEQYQNGQSVLVFGRKPITIKQEIEDTDHDDQEMVEGEALAQSSVLILGSKPSIASPDYSENIETNCVYNNTEENDDREKSDNEADYEEEQIQVSKEDIKDSVILLENWGPRLENSSCYCKDCQILFPTSNTLQAHNMTAHSFLVAVDNNKAIKSTAKGNRNTANHNPLDKGRFCNHCQKIFPDPDSLINHLYKNLSFDENNPLLKRKDSALPTPQKVLVTPPKIMVKPEESKIQAIRPFQQQNEDQIEKFLHCHICGFIFKSAVNYAKHMQTFHLSNDLDTERLPFTGQCPHCKFSSSNANRVNKHIYRTHYSIYNAKGKAIQKVISRPTTDLVTPSKIMVKTDEPKVRASQPFRQQTADYLYCNICGCFFKRTKLYVKHLKKSHACNDVDMKRVPFIGQCPHCTYFSSKQVDFMRHIHRTHNSIFNAKGKGIQKLIPKPTTEYRKVYKYKCLRCQEVFPNYYSTRNHRLLKHPSLKQRQNLFLKITTVTNAPSVVVKKAVMPAVHPQKQSHLFPPQISDHFPIANPPVPKSVLFKCNQCHLHFTSCTIAVTHTKNCIQYKDDWKCQICHRMFKVGDKMVHQLQHQHTSNFDVHVSEENIYGRVLNECPDCGLYFCEKKFFNHVKNECKGASVKCKDCGLPIHVSSIDEHGQWHQIMNLTRHDLILVEFVKENKMKASSEVGMKRKLADEAEAPTSSKRQKLSAKVSLYYCGFCSCYMIGVRHINLHEQGKCRDAHAILSRRRICKICGLMHTSDKHIKIHEMYPGITIYDINFISVVGRKNVNPPMPDFPKCNKCGVHFCRAESIAAHKCTDSHKTCNLCNKTFSDLAYKLHLRFHEYPHRAKHTKTMVAYKKSTSPEPSGSNQPHTEEMPELLKKYEMLTNIWHILYRCETCDILYDTYDQTVDHCQKHFNNMESYDVTVNQCRVCDLKFDSICFNKHKELHACNNKIEKGSFEILTFSYTELFTSRWLEMFTTSAKVPKKQILSGSIYNYTRSVKLRVLKDGPQDAILFQCGMCEGHVHPTSLVDHINSCNGESDDKYTCPMKNCGLQFCGPLARDMHYAQHKVTKTFKTVLFNEESDKEFNNTLRQHNIETEPEMKTDKGSRYHYYQCVKCKCCSEFGIGKSGHKCHYGNNRKRCEICKLFFVIKHFAKHESLHKIDRINRKKIKTTLFNPKLIIAEKYKSLLRQKHKTIVSQKHKAVVRLYKCKCGLHFTSTRAIEIHSESCGEDTQVSKENCSKCNRLFDTTQLVTHLCKHHSNKNNTTFEVVPWNNDKYVIFKCRKCESLFCDANEMSRHKPTCGSNSNCCSSCGLKFHSTLNHLLRHKDCAKRSIEDYDIKSTTEKSKFLYKCQDCDVYYLSNSGVQYHFLINHDTSKVVPCAHCGLNFMPQTLSKHISVHHKHYKYTRDDFIIETVAEKPALDSVNKTVDSNDQQNTSKLVLEEAVKGKSDAVLIRGKIIRKRPVTYNHKVKTLSNLSFDSYSSNLFKCHVCKVQFISANSLRSHLSRGQHSLKTSSCQKCGYVFSIFTMDKHNYVHHIKKRLKREQFKLKSVRGCNTVVDYNSDCEENKNTVSDNNVEPIYVDNDDTKDSDNSKFMQLVYEDASEAELNNVTSDATTSAFEPLKISHKNKTSKDSNNIKNNKIIKGRIIKHENILYKCRLCTLHFLQFHSLQSHICKIHTQNESSSMKKTCNICHLDFTPVSLRKHKIIHHKYQKLNTNDFHVIIFGKQIKRVGSNNLFQCNICYVNFAKIDHLKDHMRTRGHNSKYTHCKICGYRFLTHVNISRHIAIQHKDMKLSREDFVVLQYYGKDKLIFLNKSNTDKELSEDAESAELKDAVSDNYSNEIYKCTLCETHYMLRANLYNHKPNCNQTPTTNCSICSLKFSRYLIRKHIYIHHEQMGLKLEDICVIDVVAGSAASADTVTDEETDKVTDKDVADDTVNSVESDNAQLTPSKPADKENTNKRKSFNFTNIDITIYNRNLYKCSLCSVYFLTHNSLVAHVKKHCRNTGHQNARHKYTCKICGLSFLGSTLKKHVYIHHDQFKLSLEQINIIDDTTLSTVVDDKMSMKTETNRLFHCEKCSLNFVIHNTLEKHLQYCDGTISKFDCKICGLLFTKGSLKNHTTIHHEKNNFSLKDFHIINRWFEVVNLKQETTETAQNDVENIAEDEPKENTETTSPLNEQTIAEDQPKEITENISTLNTDLYTNKLYKCDSCSTYFLTADIMEWHTRNSKHDVEKVKCTSCGYNFTVNDLATHVFIHHDKMGLTTEQFEITSCSEIVDDCTQTAVTAPDVNVVYNDNSEDSNDVKSISSDIEIVEPITESREICHDDLEPQIEEEEGDISNDSIHLILDDVEGARIDDNIAATFEDTSAASESADPLANTEPSFDNEECKDENASEYNAQLDVNLTETNESSNENVQSNSTESPREQTPQSTSQTNDSERQSFKIKLYKCGECNVCFLTQAICYKHVIKHTPLDPKEYIECKLCGFQFVIVNSLARHIAKHHQVPFKQEEVLVEEYQPNILCHGTPKIEIYHGIDKLQSKLISTTSEGNVSSDFSDLENDKDVARTSDCSDESGNVEKINIDDIIVLD